MSARTRLVELSNGVEISTPLLVPSFSSRAWAPIGIPQEPGSRRTLQPSSRWQSKVLLGTIEEALLVSAYDIGHDLLERSDAFRQGFAESPYHQPSLLIIDSGWYEKDAAAGSVVWSDLDAPLDWERNDFERTLDSFESNVQAVVVSWDERGSYEEQIASAQEFFASRQQYARCVLLKPPGESIFHRFERISPATAADLRAFDVVGVTEKDLGRTLVDRLSGLSKLRGDLDDADVDAPIHVFGGLDPLFTPLYVAAGAEIFDGLGWVRYAYRDGKALHVESAAVLDGAAEDSFEVVRARTAIRNLTELRDLSGELKVFAKTADWDQIRNNGENFKRVFERIQARIGGSRGR